ncbi:hypothetical protein M409DRAFT_55184 [Zasmidium cellare ATCC 36951]|uniref:F-box domain-containing protein n=1 Tax=Zasmidium cellare ATCC 36951 TaxID=1080233 RepID=A0A6A6CIB1_ZASCE|nr:uncharacterized protein M409DRAFT_55184 [Zasmidium cellare ATCC 36951]KAF2166343.1 hypothetical protein M409DRAFT_55184 [Zasmidium cellare ATCC 36951]
MPLRRKKKFHDLHSDHDNDYDSRRSHKRRRVHSPAPPRRRPRSLPFLLLLPLELRYLIYEHLFPTPPHQQIYLCLANDHRTPRRTAHSHLGPCNPHAGLHTAAALSNTCRQLRREVQERFFLRQNFVLGVCNLSPTRGPSHRRAWCLCALVLRRINTLYIRYPSLVIPDFTLIKSHDGRQVVRFTESAEREGKVLGRFVGVERRAEYVARRRWCMRAIWRNFERRERRVVGFGWREVEEVEVFLKGVQRDWDWNWCQSSSASVPTGDVQHVLAVFVRGHCE